MAYQFLGAATAQNQLVDQVIPTIVIGVGGTGRQILLRLRRKFVQRYGTLNRFPVVRFLYLDTDASQAVQDTLGQQDPVLKRIEFTAAERIDLRVNVGDYVQNIDAYPHIKRWLAAGDIRGNMAKLGDLREGAGQIRPAARLALFRHFSDVRDALTQARAHVTNIQNQQRMAELGMNPNFNDLAIYVVASIAGGTGSGVFLDLGYLLKSLFPQSRRVAFLVLPSLFAVHGARTLANGYAALRELEHFQWDHLFDVQWTAGVAAQRFQPPPFSYTYLIDNENEANQPIQPQQASYLYEMVAENVFQDFATTTFAAYKRSVKINLDQFLMRLFTYSHLNALGQNVLNETFSCRYSAFGCSAISFPADRIKLSCSYKLIGDVVDYWTKELDTQAGGTLGDVLANEILPELDLLEGRATIAGRPVERHDVLSALYVFTLGTGDDFFNKIAADLQEVERAVLRGAPEQKGQAWQEYLLEELRAFEFKFHRPDAGAADQPGDYFQKLLDNKLRLLERLVPKAPKEGDLKRVIDRFVVHNPNRGPQYAINVLTRMKHRLLEDPLSEYAVRWDKEKKELEPKVVEAKGRLLESLEALEKIQDWRGRPSWHRRKGLEAQLRQRVIPRFQEYLEAVVRKTARVFALDLAARIGEVIGDENNGLVKLYTDLLAGVKELKLDTQVKQRFFREKEETPLVLNLYKESDIEEVYYPRYMGTDDAVRGERVREAAMRILGRLEARNLAEIDTHIKTLGLDFVQDRMLAVTRAVFDTLATDFNVLDLLYSGRYLRAEEVEDKVITMYQRGKAWVRQREVINFNLPQQQRKLYLGMPAAPAAQQNDRLFRTLMDAKQPAGDPPVEFHPLGDNSQIAFYCEYAGLIVGAVAPVVSFREEYLRELEAGSDLHIDKNYFHYNDIIPLSPDERAEAIEAREALLMGSILGVLSISNVTVDGTVLHAYEWKSPDPFMPRRVIGVERRAKEVLFMDRALRSEIMKEIHARLEQAERLGRLPELLALVLHYNELIYPIQQVPTPGGAMAIRAELENDLLHQHADRIRQRGGSTISEDAKKLLPNIDQFTRRIGDGEKRALNVFVQGAAMS